MLIVPRLYSQYGSHKEHEVDASDESNGHDNPVAEEKPETQDATDVGWFKRRRAVKPTDPRNMLLLHQTGSVKVGEVVRYTVTYTPSLDRILPPPQHLHVKIKNTSAIPLRAAYLHGPYTLYVSSYPSTFDPYVKQEHVQEEGSPEYEPQLKAGGSWTAQLTVPPEVRASVEERPRGQAEERKSFTWIIEIASQVLFSTTAAVHYELLVGRDEKSVATGITGVVSHGEGLPGKLEDLQSKRTELKAEVQTRGVFSKAVRLAVDDTETLWNTPPFPSWDSQGDVDVKPGPEHGDKRDTRDKQNTKQRKRKKIHLVILTHGIHSNLGADMLYMKETIDTAARQAKEDAKQRRAELRAKEVQQEYEFGRDASGLRSKSVPDIAIAPTPEMEEEEDEEQVLVRGFNGNAVKTEKGIQYLGKRLAKYVLSITYPDQPFLPVKSSLSKTITRSLTIQKTNDSDGPKPTHKHSSIVKDEKHMNHNLAYQITSISFISHSLGGLVQTYAVAYIQKHSPEFFDRINPINFVALASPFLGLSNENPMYVKFALDFGLVGRTGQDLGLTWRAPTIAQKGWGAMVNGLVNDPHKDRQPSPSAKPLLRILPTGPAHQALKLFRNRTVYSNVVNDGIVPLRTSCLLFLDWRGLGRVEKARRENGLIGTVVNWGWNEMTGVNASAPKKQSMWNDLFSDDADDSSNEPGDPSSAVPDARASQFLDDDRRESSGADNGVEKMTSNSTGKDAAKEDAKEQQSNMWTGLMSWFRPQAASKPVETESTSLRTSGSQKRKKLPRIYSRGQIRGADESEPPSPTKPGTSDSGYDKPRGPVRGASLYNSADDSLEAPPKTTIFESAGDLLSPPLPPREFLLDPAARPRTIFHDRVYHPEDIPPPPSKRQKTFMSFNSSRKNSKEDKDGAVVPNQAHGDLSRISSSKSDPGDSGGMKIEEKIARAYHKDMAWRKVLVSMEPDAHNNMIVRRMFANAYGWPVVKHLCDTHFAYTAAAQTRDDDEPTEERAKPVTEAVGKTGEQVKGQVEPPADEQIRSSEHEHDTRSKSVDTAIAHSHHQADKPRASSQTIDSLINRVRSREKSQSGTTRSASEVRESRDEVKDLVSMASVTATGTASNSYSNSSHSGTSALHRLARKDSGRWSDRFFDGSDYDSEEDDAYFEEIRRARQRGDVFVDDSDAGVQGRLGDRKGSHQIQPPHLVTDNNAMVAEPDPMTPVSRRASGAESADPKTLSLTDVGLGTSPSQRVFDGEQHNATIVEQVALAAGRRSGDAV